MTPAEVGARLHALTAALIRKRDENALAMVLAIFRLLAIGRVARFAGLLATAVTVDTARRGLGARGGVNVRAKLVSRSLHHSVWYMVRIHCVNFWNTRRIRRRSWAYGEGRRGSK